MTYQELRTAHFRTTLKVWFRGLDKAAIAVVAVLQFIFTAMVIMLVVGLAQGLQQFMAPDTTLSRRALILAAWQFVSFVLLRGLREAALMPRTRAFFDALPITPRQKLRADLLLSLQGYSILWLPVGWVLFMSFSEPTPGTLISTVMTLASLVALSVCVNLALLRGAWTAALLCAAPLAAFSLPHGTAARVAAAKLACAATATFALWRSYLPRPSRLRSRPVRSPLADALALRTGLVVPLLANELRSNLLIRIGVIAATLLACLLVIALRTNDASTASVVVFVAAAAALALYRLPMLIRTTLLTKLQFLAGQPAFATRMRLAAYGIPGILFCGAALTAIPFDASGTAGRDAAIFATLYIAGVIGTRLKIEAIHWLMPLATAVSLIVAGAML